MILLIADRHLLLFIHLKFMIIYLRIIHRPRPHPTQGFCIPCGFCESDCGHWSRIQWRTVCMRLSKNTNTKTLRLILSWGTLLLAVSIGFSLIQWFSCDIELFQLSCWEQTSEGWQKHHCLSSRTLWSCDHLFGAEVVIKETLKLLAYISHVDL